MGATVGSEEMDGMGVNVGSMDGKSDGTSEGISEGESLGSIEVVGMPVGALLAVGPDVVVGELEGGIVEGLTVAGAFDGRIEIVGVTVGNVPRGRIQ